jgi:dTMP kinase
MIICLEGINGSGKSTLADAIVEQWTAATGGTAQRVEPVQATGFGRSVRAAIMAAGDLNVDAEALAFGSARLHAAAILRPIAMSPNELIVLERWAGAVMAYGAAVGTNPVLLHMVESALLEAMPIHHTMVVDVTGRTAAERLVTQQNTNRFEVQGAAYLERVRQEYLLWARRQGVAVVDGQQPEPQARTCAEQTVEALLAAALT